MLLVLRISRKVMFDFVVLDVILLFILNVRARSLNLSRRQFCQLQASLHDSKLKEAIKLCGFKIIHQNIQSLKRKIDELRLFIQELESDIHLLALTKTWAKIDMLDVEFNLPGSELFRPDRGF